MIVFLVSTYRDDSPVTRSSFYFRVSFFFTSEFWSVLGWRVWCLGDVSPPRLGLSPQRLGQCGGWRVWCLGNLSPQSLGLSPQCVGQCRGGGFGVWETSHLRVSVSVGVTGPVAEGRSGERSPILCMARATSPGRRSPASGHKMTWVSPPVRAPTAAAAHTSADTSTSSTSALLVQMAVSLPTPATVRTGYCWCRQLC